VSRWLAGCWQVFEVSDIGSAATALQEVQMVDVGGAVSATPAGGVPGQRRVPFNFES